VWPTRPCGDAGGVHFIIQADAALRRGLTQTLDPARQMTEPSNSWNTLAPHILVVALLLWALLPSNPYGYYSVMRWIVCAIFVYLAVKSHEQQQQTWVWVWGVLAGIYNPIFPVHATREFWSLVNIATIAAVVFGAFKTRNSDS